MTEKVLLGETLRGAKAELDLQELITGRTLLCSITRFGKTWTARRIVEQVFGKTGIIVVDIEGEYSTLRDKYPLLIIGKDVPLVPESAAFLADQVLEHDLSTIIDLSDPELDIAAGQEFVARFIDRFIAMETQARKPYLWILEECDELAPEKGISKSICLEQVRKLVKKGGKRGMGAIALTQRPAFVSKFVISQCSNKIIGRTEWPDDLAVLRKFGRIPERLSDPESKDEHAIKNLKAGQFYVAGTFIARDELVKVGPVETKHLGATPEVVPPAPTELKEVLKQLNEKLPEVIKEKIAPAIPSVKEIEARLREKFEAQWQARYQRKEKEVQSIKGRMEAKYETQIADLNRKLDDATRQSAMAGPVSDILEHPLVKKNLEKLNPKQRGLVELLERRGPQEAKSLSLFIERPPSKVSQFVWEVNSKIKGLIAREGDRYVSKLVDLFPVTEEAKAQVDLREKLELTVKALDNSQRVLADERIKHHEEVLGLERRLEFATGERDEFKKKIEDYERLKAELEEEFQQKPSVTHDLPPAIPTEVPPDAKNLGTQPYVGVDVTLRRKLTSFDVEVSHEKVEVDESTWKGKILARGLKGFFDQEKAHGTVMAELERVYGTSRTSGGTRDAVRDALEELCSIGVLERQGSTGNWLYRASPEFRERVRKA